jgi:serine/threonine protein kinase
MNAPATADEFLALVRKSGIADDKRLTAYLKKDRPTSPLPSEPRALAEQLVRDGLITHFQAEQFMQGKWRRFTIGNYKVLERIGSGGMGSVFLCEHKSMRRRAAVKVLPTAQANDPAALERFYREARAVAALDHPNIVRAYDIDQEDNLHFLVMEYVDGSSLQEIIQRVGPLDPIRAAHYISQSALGLQHAHEVAALVHRDIKPGNILVDRSGTVKVLDLGLARFFYDEDDLLTKKYDETVLGTADYLAPEQALDSHSVDIRGDIYSLGGTFYFCLTGLSPFSEGTVAQKLIWHQTRQPKPIRAFRPDVPAEMIAIVNKMMAKDPAQRYQTPLEVAQALLPWTQDCIAPPAENEMPRLSPAAQARNLGEMSASLITPTPLGPLSSRARKVWQVPGSPTPQLNVRSSPPASPPAKPTAAPDSYAPKTPDAKPVAKPVLATPPVKPEKAKGAAVSIVPAELKLAEPQDSEASAQPAAYALPSQKEDPLPWVSLAMETENPAAKADTDPHTPKKPVSRRQRRSKVSAHTKHKRQQHWWWWGSMGGTAFVVLVGILVWAIVLGKKPKAIDQPATPPPLIVSRSGQENTLRTVSEAIRKAKDKDHILVLDDIEEQLELTGSNKELVLEANPGKSVVWRFPRSVASGKELVFLNGVGNLRIRGFTFDGRNYVDQILFITGHCPGLTLEDIQLRRFRNYGILMANCAGSKEKPVSLLGVQAPTTREKEAAIAFTLNARVASPKLNEHILVQDCRFDGPYKTPVRLSDASVIKDVVFRQNTPTNLIPASK